MITSQPYRVSVSNQQDQVDINKSFNFVTKFKPIYDGGYEQRFVNFISIHPFNIVAPKVLAFDLIRTSE